MQIHLPTTGSPETDRLIRLAFEAILNVFLDRLARWRKRKKKKKG
jgi:hypothetical protein